MAPHSSTRTVRRWRRAIGTLAVAAAAIIPGAQIAAATGTVTLTVLVTAADGTSLVGTNRYVAATPTGSSPVVLSPVPGHPGAYIGTVPAATSVTLNISHSIAWTSYELATATSRPGAFEIVTKAIAVGATDTTIDLAIPMSLVSLSVARADGSTGAWQGSIDCGVPSTNPPAWGYGLASVHYSLGYLHSSFSYGLLTAGADGQVSAWIPDGLSCTSFQIDSGFGYTFQVPEFGVSGPSAIQRTAPTAVTLSGAVPVPTTQTQLRATTGTPGVRYSVQNFGVANAATGAWSITAPAGTHELYATVYTPRWTGTLSGIPLVANGDAQIDTSYALRPVTVRVVDANGDPVTVLSGSLMSSCTQLARKVAQCQFVAQCQRLRSAKGCRVPIVAQCQTR